MYPWQRELEKYIPSYLYEAMLNIQCAQAVEELRIKVDAPILLKLNSRDYYLSPQGETIHEDKAIVLDVGRFHTLLDMLASHSLYRFQEDMAKGFFTVGQGMRIGVGGSCVMEGKQVKKMSHISSLNIRFPRQMLHISKNILPYLVEDGQWKNTLIVSGPCLGKTTLLRDLVRCISSGEGIPPKRCLVVDERSEICAAQEGVPQFDVGIRTDLLDGVIKSQGIMMGLRSLAPEVIATDEIGRAEDLEAVYECLNCGVKMLLTAHGGDEKQIMSRLFFQEIAKNRAIERYVFLSADLGKGTVSEILDENRVSILDKPFVLK